MNNDQMSKFLAQFEASRKEVAQWPTWMKDAAGVASASFPESKVPESKSGQSFASKSKA
ncbi:hypothetical protein V4C53_14425 [Paraburkholderia azotifigens]|uniref:hypothetical protein n=1 Tax=Paraburkholderia azotifigens TaxID=2057004 RepID=UPI000A8D9656